MLIPEFYVVGDIIEFIEDFWGWTDGTNLEIVKGTLARVISVIPSLPRNGISDSGQINLIISVFYKEGDNVCLHTLKLNYQEHYHYIIKRPAAQVLYNKG